jgi:hypothetical protein
MAFTGGRGTLLEAVAYLSEFVIVTRFGGYIASQTKQSFATSHYQNSLLKYIAIIHCYSLLL